MIIYFNGRQCPSRQKARPSNGSGGFHDQADDVEMVLNSKTAKLLSCFESWAVDHIDKKSGKLNPIVSVWGLGLR